VVTLHRCIDLVSAAEMLKNGCSNSTITSWTVQAIIVNLDIEYYKIKWIHYIGFQYRRVSLNLAFKTTTCPQLLLKTDWMLYIIMHSSLWFSEKQNRTNFHFPAHVHIFILSSYKTEIDIGQYLSFVISEKFNATKLFLLQLKNLRHNSLWKSIIYLP